MISPEIISRIIKLVDRNNERVVLVDPASGKGVVVMDLDAYERLSAVDAGSPQRIQEPVTEAAPTVTAPAPAAVAAVAPAAVAPISASSESAAGTPAAAASTIRASQPETPTVQNQGQIQAKTQSQSQSFTATAKIEETIINPFPIINKEKGSQKKNSKNDPLATPAFADLTQSELLDKINRDIATWKTAQERRRTDELRSAAMVTASAATDEAFEDEERFYLEPIE